MKLNWCVCQVSSDSGYVSYRIPAREAGWGPELSGVCTWRRAPPRAHSMLPPPGTAGKRPPQLFLRGLPRPPSAALLCVPYKVPLQAKDGG